MGDRVGAAGDGGETVAENAKKDRLAEMAEMMEWARDDGVGGEAEEEEGGDE